MRYAIILLAMLITSGCTDDWYVGKWSVSDAKFPGISAMGMDEAKEWFGSELVYSQSQVSFRGETCDSPEFTVTALTEDDFRASYRATFSALAIEGEFVEVLHVGCPSNWISPGSTFIRANPNMGYILWDGAFFQLDRSAH